MLEFLEAQFEAGPMASPAVVALRLVAAMILGGIVVFVYRRTRSPEEVTESFTVTLVLLAILIAMVTQVIGDNVARAFSLVGALSIVRFRTVVRDTQDTAYVIFAVVVGMAAGAGDPWVAGFGIVVVATAAYLMRVRPVPALSGAEVGMSRPCTLKLKVDEKQDVNAGVGPVLDRYLSERRLKSMGTGSEGSTMDLSYEGDLKADDSAEALVKELNQMNGVESVQLQRRKPKGKT